MAYKYTSLEMSAAERYSLYESWVLSKGFQELARGVHETLEQALIFIEMLKDQPRQTTWAEFQDHVEQLQHRAGRLPFPALLAEINTGLKSPMTFDDDFKSFQKVRNCLEHRAGVVGKPDVDASGHLNLMLPRLKMFYLDKVKKVPRSNCKPELLSTDMSIPTWSRYSSNAKRVRAHMHLAKKCSSRPQNSRNLRSPAICLQAISPQNFGYRLTILPVAHSGLAPLH